MSLQNRDAGAPALKSSSPEQGPRVIIISNVLLYREGLAASLARDGRLAVLAALNASDAQVALAGLSPDAVLIDASMKDGLALARQIRADHPSVRLVGFGIAGGAASYLACAESGLSGFVHSNGTVHELVTAVQSALCGELRCSPEVTAMICDRLASLVGAQDGATVALTRREREVAALIAEGLSNKEIANDLRIGPATVKNHVHNILDKLKVRRRAAIAGHVRQVALTRMAGLEHVPATGNAWPRQGFGAFARQPARDMSPDPERRRES